LGVIPAYLVERPIIKNMAIKSIPNIKEINNQLLLAIPSKSIGIPPIKIPVVAAAR
jgi:hypothetical protein